MLMDKHRSTFISLLKQPVGWLNGYHPNIGYLFHFNYVHWINRGPLLFPLWGAQWIAGLKRGMEIIPLWGVYLYIIYICFNHAHVSSKVVSPYTSGKKAPILSLMLTISFTVTKFPQVFLGLSRICLLNAMSMSHYFFCRSQGADFCTLTLAICFFCRYPRCIVGYCLSQGADFSTLT